MTLTELTTPRPLGDASFEIDIHDGWQQGRGAFGGLVLASMVRAIDRVHADQTRSLRVLTAELFAPVMTGTARIDVLPLRVGSGVSTFSAVLSQGDGAAARCTAVFGKPRGTEPSDTRLTKPSVPSWKEVFPAPVEPPLAPRFATFFEYRVTGTPPMSMATEPETHGYVRSKARGDAFDAAHVVALADVWWPSSLVTLAGPRNVATIAFTLELVSDLSGLDPDAPFFFRGRRVAAAGGYEVDFRELWGEDGRLVALNQQTFAVLK